MDSSELIQKKSSDTRNDESCCDESSIRGKLLWKKVRDNISLIIPPKEIISYRRPKIPIFMFDPESNFKSKWDLGLALCVFYTSCVVPLRISFNLDSSGFFWGLELIIDICFFLDIIFSFRTGIIHPTTGHIYYNKKRIAYSYLRGWFLIDLASTLPLETIANLISTNTSDSYQSAKILRGLKLARLLKLVRIRKISLMISKFEEQVFANQSVVALFKILLFLLFLAHLVACVWFYIAQVSTYSWAATMGYMDTDHQHVVTLQYLSSLYWAIVTMTTVGYGDITPKTRTELIIAMLVMIIGVSMFGYIIGNITSLVDNINASGRMQSERITCIKEYIISRQFPKHLGKRILDHFEYYYRHHSVFDEENILSKLTTVMRTDVISHAYEEFIQHNNFLQGFHQTLICDIVLGMQPMYCLKDDFIYKKKDIANHIYFLIKGLVSVAIDRESNFQTIYSRGQHFGEVELYHVEFGQGVRITNAIATTYCQLTFISRQTLESIGQTWPELLGLLNTSSNKNENFIQGIHEDQIQSCESAKIYPLTEIKLDTIPAPDSPNIESPTEELKFLNKNDKIKLISRPAMTEKQFAHKNYVFHPQDTFLVNWQMTVATAIIYASIMVPYRIGFDDEPVAEGVYLDKFVDILFGMDIFITFRIAYYNKERHLICDTKKISKIYLKGWFFIDFISTIPFDSIATYFSKSTQSTEIFQPTKFLRLFRVARLFKLMRLLKIGKIFKRIRDSIQLSPSSERLLKLIIIMVCFGHWCACIFHWIMMLEEEYSSRTWCTNYFFPYDEDPGACTIRVPSQDRYIASLYWAFMTMTTVGYGDIVPYKFSIPELIFAVVCLMVNSTVFAYVVSGFVQVIQNFNPSDREHRTQLNEMKDYIRDTGLNIRLSNIVKRHYDFRLTWNCLFSEEIIFNQLKPSLRYEVAKIVVENSLSKLGIFALMEAKYKGFASYVMFFLQPQFILRSEYVCRTGTPAKEMYFIVQGKCYQIFDSSQYGRVLSENQQIETYAMVAPAEEMYRSHSSVTALTPTCQLYAMGLDDFRSVADISPAIFKYFTCELARSILRDKTLQLGENQRKFVLDILE